MVADVDTASVLSWLSRAKPGHCGATNFKDEGDCEIGVQGNFNLNVWRNASEINCPGLSKTACSWTVAVHACLQRCIACSRCLHVSVSILDQDCSWFSSCSHSTLVKTPNTFQSAPASTSAPGIAPLPLWLSTGLRLEEQSTEAVSDSAFLPSESLSPSESAWYVAARRQLSPTEHWLSTTSAGVCSSTAIRPPPNRSAGCSAHRSWSIRALGRHSGLHPGSELNWTAAAARCLHLCMQCDHCHYLSVNRQKQQCSWTDEECDLGGLHPFFGFDTFRTAPVHRHHSVGAGATHPSSVHRHHRARPLAGRTDGSTAYQHTYAFFASVHRAPCAVRQLVSEVRRVYGRSAPIYLHTDNARGRGALNFSRLCVALGCEWDYSEQAAGNPLAYRGGYETDVGLGVVYLQRLIVKMRVCACEFLVALEDDVCVQRVALRPPRTGDVGGLPGPIFSEQFIRFAENATQARIPRPAVWGCAGACYYRTDAFVATASRFTPELAATAFANEAWAVGYMDAVGPALGLLTGLRVVPWTALAQTHAEGLGFMQHIPHEERAFDHKCDEAKRRRGGGDGACGEVLWSSFG